MKLRYITAAAAAAVTLINVGDTFAAITEETDSTTFLTGIVIEGTQSFDGLTAGPVASPQAFGIGSVSFTASAPSGLRAVANTGNPTDLYLSTASPDEPITLDFTGQNVNAVGLELFLLDSNDAFAFQELPFTAQNVGGDVLSSDVFATDGETFIGLTSDSPLTTLTISTLNPFLFVAIDAMAVQIPEPTTAALLGLAGLTLLRRRRNS